MLNALVGVQDINEQKQTKHQQQQQVKPHLILSLSRILHDQPLKDSKTVKDTQLNKGANKRPSVWCSCTRHSILCQVPPHAGTYRISEATPPASQG